MDKILRIDGLAIPYVGDLDGRFTIDLDILKLLLGPDQAARMLEAIPRELHARSIRLQIPFITYYADRPKPPS